METNWREASDLLLIRLDNLGDVLLTTPAIHAIKESLPQARLTLLASAVGGQVAELNDDIDDVLVYEAPWMDVAGTLPQDSAREQAFIRSLKQRRFDGAIIFTSYHQSSLPAAYMAYLADIPLRHAASIDFPGTLLTSRHHHGEELVHEVERALNLVASIGFVSANKDMVLNVPSPLVAEMRRILAQRGVDFSRPIVIIHPGCSCQARTYPGEGYAQVADLLIEKCGAQVIITGLASEVPVVTSLLQQMRHQAVSLAGQTDFKQLAALISLSDVAITNNTGPMHVCSCLKVPVVVLFAQTNPPEQWGPWNTPHRLLTHATSCHTPCYQFVCPTDHRCLAGITPSEVVAATGELLQESYRGALCPHA